MESLQKQSASYFPRIYVLFSQERLYKEIYRRHQIPGRLDVIRKHFNFPEEPKMVQEHINFPGEAKRTRTHQ